MLIWLLAFLCFGLFASAGQLQGAVRMSIQFVGLLIAALLAVPLAPLVKPLLPWVGFGHPVWSWCLPPIVVFFAIVFAFGTVAQVVGHKIYVFYAYKTKDDDRIFWERMNCRLGICVGFLCGGVYLILLGLLIYIAGYFSTQVEPKEPSFGIKVLNAASKDLKSTGLEKIVNAINPVPASYYDAADIAGLLYNNASLRARLADYPLFLAFPERADIKAAIADKEFQTALTDQISVADILETGSGKALFNNTEYIELAKTIDTKDLLEFLKTGKSTKYAAEKMIGHWQIDINGTLNAVRKKSDRSVTDLKYLQGLMRNMLPDISLTAAGDGKALLYGSTKDVNQMLGVFKFQLKPGVLPLPKLPTAVRPFATNTFKLLASGTWKKSGEDYTVTVENLPEGTSEIKDGRLTVTLSSYPVVFQYVD